jgi:hypothetical protein
LVDITIIGGGGAARACTDLLTAAGFDLRRTFAFDNEDRSPIILGEVPAALNIARQAVESGRHLLIANPHQYSPERLGLLYEGRRSAQALFLWSARRYHPSYRFVSSLIQSDPTWQPHHLRHESLTTEPASTGLASWSLIEAASLVTGLTSEAPVSVAASAAMNPLRNANELLNLAVEFPGVQAFILVGLAEAIERRETLIAGQRRRIFIDELSPTVPLRLISDDAGGEQPAARQLSTSIPGAEEAARQQCLAFLDSTLHPAQTQDEAKLWTRAFAIGVASRQSLLNNGAATEVVLRESEAPRFRVIPSIA